MSDVLVEHRSCRWIEIPPCVWCADHPDVRLYMGALPPDRAPEQRQHCSHPDEQQDHETGMGFYVICGVCGAQGFWEWETPEPGHLRGEEWLVWS
jgi:hypothetical protein